MSSEWICPICLSPESSEEQCYTLSPCNHKFHVDCIIKSLRINGKECPYCRGVDKAEEEKSSFLNESINYTELPSEISIIYDYSDTETNMVFDIAGNEISAFNDENMFDSEENIDFNQDNVNNTEENILKEELRIAFLDASQDSKKLVLEVLKLINTSI